MNFSVGFVSMMMGVAMLSASSAGAREGAFSGNGADHVRPEQDAAWFLGDRAIRYCFVRSADFGAGALEIESELRSSFDVWRRYIADKKASDLRLHPLDIVGGGRMIFASGAKISARTDAMPACDGSEDLKFYFGVRDETVSKYVGQFREPTAFAQLLKRADAGGWAKGFVWVRSSGSVAQGIPDWSLPHRLKGILLHELGHVFGNGHVRGTIMDEEIGAKVLDVSFPAKLAQTLFGRVDSERELLFCRGCPRRIEWKDARIEDADFRKWMGRSRTGGADVLLEGPLRSGPAGDDFELKIRDLVSEERFEIWATAVLADLSGDVPVFKRAMKNDSGYWEIASLKTSGLIYSAFLSRKGDPGARRFPVLIKRNVWEKGKRAAGFEMGEVGPQGIRSLLEMPGDSR